MLRLTRWSLGGAVSRVAAAAASKQRGRKPSSQSARGRPRSQSARGRKPSSQSARGRPPSQSARGRKPSSQSARGHPPSKPGRRGRGRSSRASSPSQLAEAATKHKPPVEAKLVAFTSDTDAGTKYASARPAYMSAEREQEVLQMAERMQKKDTTTEVPVASFAYEILKAHPSVRDMGLRERMDFLLKRWDRLSKAQKLDYVNDPLRGLL
ncbi:hypothetical protein LSCM4_04770 [Leishmania orientalis]|uniref:Uncharacterized protein n=1 Tax=Leishmania orientalis TaxID=2249476 RepID=A0A836KMI2_9TRYP|nr:hypothetical protein LSCM4_04770 [Leishmania orientalis]